MRMWQGLLLTMTLFVLPQAAWAGPPFETDDPEPVETGHWEVYAFSAGAVGQHASTGLGPSLEVNYGAAPNLQLHMIVPTAFDAPHGARAAFGMGDAELGAKYRLINPGEHDWYPELGIFPLIELPTGKSSRNLGAGQVQVFLPVWLQKSFGKWTTYGGGGYWINPGAGNRNYWYTGWLLQRQVTEKLMLGGELFHQTANMTGRGGSAGFNLGGQYDLTPHHHLLFSSGHGGLSYAIDGGAVAHPSTYYLAYQWTF